MKAIRVREFGGPEVLKLEDVPALQSGEGQVLVRVHAAGVNPVDTYIRSGTYSLKPDLPYTPGLDGAGVIEALGRGVERVTVGERVYFGGSASGSYAEQCLCEETQVYRLPDSVSFAQGAAVNVPYATAYRALVQRAHAVAGETVLVHGGTGGVGIASVQLARAAGLKVIATGGSKRGRELASNEGAHHVVDHHAPDYLQGIRDLTEGRGVDVILEMLANVNLGSDLSVLAPGGRVVVIGSRGTVEVNPREAMSREASILGVLLLKAALPELEEAHAAIYAGLENETLRPVVGQQIPLGEASRAHEAVMEPGAYGNIVLTMPS